MRSLRLKLIITFLAISVAGTLLTALIVGLSNERAFDALLLDQQQTDFISNVLAYYQSNGSWQGIDQAMRGQVPAAPPEQEPPRPRPFALVDVDGRTLIPNPQFPINSVLTAADLAEGVPLELDGVWIGTVLIDDMPPARDPAEETFVAQTNQALLLGALGGTAVAVVLAIILARTLTQPLQELSTASRQMAQGDLLQEVPVRTQDELGELATAFNQMSADLAQANQARRQMTADIAHDLRTPLTVLSGYLEAMGDGTLAATPARFQMMEQEVDFLNQLVKDLRTLSLADAGELTLLKEPVDIGELLAQVKAAYEHQARQQGVTIVVGMVSPPSPVNLDPARMRQALSNLVSNALRYTPAGGTITLAAKPQAASGLQIMVSDTGSGIPAADLPHIFNRFYRGDKSRTDGEGESGLGLAIVKSLVTAHGGKITVDSTRDVGTTFTILLMGA